ncbi:PREDICTED: F-box only protein 36 [Fulmarus glacialis]|uniref:F-box only protein 36 n=1 Tax=Fulmarus glacialis TaxID=30455 RepID=UPI00051C2A31|nr:PREDICTED: F-box only protein 36 [Fulmarus glacialis]
MPVLTSSLAGVAIEPFGGTSTVVSLLQETLHVLQCQSPSPSRDFHCFTITSAELESIFPEQGQAAFRVSQGRSQEGVLGRQPVRNVFGNNTLEYTVNLCQGHYNFLIRMPENVIIHILSFLDADDLQQLSKTCEKFQQLHSSEEVWERVKLLRDKPALVFRNTIAHDRLEPNSSLTDTVISILLNVDDSGLNKKQGNKNSVKLSSR